MPTPETIERFVALVEANTHVEAVEAFYAHDVVMYENQSVPRLGRDQAIANERGVLKKAKAIRSHCVRPVLVNGDHTAIRWIFEFEWLDGTGTRMEEVAWQRWQDERIVEEIFFYDPAQRKPK